MPTIGVLITYFNEGDLLTVCLNSLLSGSALPDEILIYDDCSSLPPDAFIPPGAPVRVLRGAENRGPGFGRNVLMRECRADYVHFHDADDTFHPEWCAKVRVAIETSGAQVVLTELTVLRADRTRLGETRMLGRLCKDDDLTRFAILNCLCSPQSTFTRTLGLAAGGLRPREVLEQSEDCDFHIRLASLASTFAVIHEPLFSVLLRPGSLSGHDRMGRRTGLTCGIRSSELLAGELPERYHPALAERALRRSLKLYGLGFHEEARQGLETARRLAPANGARLDRLSPARMAVGILGFRVSAVALHWLGAARVALWKARKSGG